jgi:hypothetical protein
MATLVSTGMMSIYCTPVIVQVQLFRLLSNFSMAYCAMPLMEQELPKQCRMPLEWVEIVHLRRAVRYRCPLAVKALMAVRVKGAKKLGADGVAEALAVSPKTIYDWSWGKNIRLADFLALCRLWNEHHEG